MPERVVSVELESLESIPEELHGLFDETDDGEYVGKMASADDLSEFRDTNVQLLKEQEELRNQIEDLKSQAERVTDEDLEELQRLREEAKKREEKQLADSGDTERLLEKRKAEYEEKVQSVKSELETQLESVQSERDKALSELRRIRLDRRVSELSRQHLHPDYAEDAAKLLIYEGRLALDDDGELVVKDKDGDPTTLAPEEFFETVYREERPAFYEAAGGSGGGSSSNGANPSLSGSADPLSMSVQEKTKFISKNGFAKWQELVDQAHKASASEGQSSGVLR